MLDITEDTAVAIYNIANAILFLAAILVVVGTLGNIWGSAVKDKYAGLKSQEDDRLIAQANEAAAKANEGQARANAAAEEARLEAAKANERAASLESEAAKARLELEILKEKTKPRKITPEKGAALRELLEKIPKGPLAFGTWFDAGDEAKAYTSQLRKVFEEAGFAVDPKPCGTSLFGSDGVHIHVSKTAMPAHAEPIAEAMRSLGLISRSVCRDDLIPSNKVHILVGRKPIT